MQVINETNPGAALGAALGQGLSALAQHKIQQMQQRASHQQKVQSFQALGLAPEEASAIAALPEKLQISLFQGLLDRGALGAQPEEQQAPLQQLMQPMKTAPEVPSTGMQALQQQAPQQALTQPIQQALQQVEPQITPKVQQKIKAVAPTALPEKAVEKIAAPKPKTVKEILAAREEEPKIGEEQKAAPVAKRETLVEKLRRPSAKEQAAIEKENAPFVKETTNQAKVAKDNEKRLDRMEYLTKKGYLGVPAWNSFLRALSKGISGVVNIGFDATSLMSADAQEMEKLSTDFLKGAKEIFGSRITDTDLNAFLKTVPSLSQTNEGRMRVITNLRNFNEATKIKKETMDQIIEENGGRKPANLEILVEKRVKPQLDELAKQFAVGATPQEPGGILQALDKTLLEGLLHY